MRPVKENVNADDHSFLRSIIEKVSRTATGWSTSEQVVIIEGVANNYPADSLPHRFFRGVLGLVLNHRGVDVSLLLDMAVSKLGNATSDPRASQSKTMPAPPPTNNVTESVPQNISDLPPAAVIPPSNEQAATKAPEPTNNPGSVVDTDLGSSAATARTYNQQSLNPPHQ